MSIIIGSSVTDSLLIRLLDCHQQARQDHVKPLFPPSSLRLQPGPGPVLPHQGGGRDGLPGGDLQPLRGACKLPGDLSVSQWSYKGPKKAQKRPKVGSRFISGPRRSPTPPLWKVLKGSSPCNISWKNPTHLIRFLLPHLTVYNTETSVPTRRKGTQRTPTASRQREPLTVLSVWIQVDQDVWDFSYLTARYFRLHHSHLRRGRRGNLSLQQGQCELGGVPGQDTDALWHISTLRGGHHLRCWHHHSNEDSLREHIIKFDTRDLVTATARTSPAVVPSVSSPTLALTKWKCSTSRKPSMVARMTGPTWSPSPSTVLSNAEIQLQKISITLWISI